MEGSEERREIYCLEGFMRTNVCGSWCGISGVNLCSTVRFYYRVLRWHFKDTYKLCSMQYASQCKHMQNSEVDFKHWASFGIAHFYVIQERQFSYERNTNARSHNHYCRGKTISIAHSVCFRSFSYSALKIHAPYYIVICGLSGSTIFFRYCFTNVTIFGLSETCLVLKLIHLAIDIMCIGVHIKYPLFLPEFNETWIFSTIFWNINIKFHLNSSTGNRDWCGRTDRHDEVHSRFSRFCERP